MVPESADPSQRERSDRGRLFAVATALGVAFAHSSSQSTIVHAVLLASAGLGVWAGSLLGPRPSTGRAIAFVGLGVVGAALSVHLVHSPTALVVFGLAATGVVGYLSADPLHPHGIDNPAAHTARRALSVVAGGALALSLWSASPWVWMHLAVAAGLAGTLAVRAWPSETHTRVDRGLGWGAVTVSLGACALVYWHPVIAQIALAAGCLLARFAIHVSSTSAHHPPSAWAQLLERPARVLVLTFAILSAISAGVLTLPSSLERPIAALDALFTAVSAVCVTGLAVVDTSTTFSTFGQCVILISMQVGGLGIMTFYTVALFTLGRRVSLRHEAAVAGALNVDAPHLVEFSVKRVLLVTGIAEGLGTLALTVAFTAEGEPVGHAAWRALFTSVSAFCNAGFSLQSDSLVSYAENPAVLHIVALLIVVGGLSPAAIFAIPRWVRREQVGLQQRLILWTSAVLVVAGFIAYATMEWSRTLGGMHWLDRLHNAWFQSITLRTAGFNSVDLAAARPATQTIMVIFMFIGGSPGGTAGGVKTTTAAVLALTVMATLRGRPEAAALGRTIARRTVYKAAAVAMVGLGLVLALLVAVQLTQAIRAEVAVFEVVSALATVGLSIGGTAELDAIGKLLIALGMFIGRIGPLTLFLFLVDKETGPALLGLPESKVEVG